MKKTKKTFEQQLIESFKFANDYHDGKISLKSTSLELPDPPKPHKKKEIKLIREKLKLSLACCG